MSSKELGIKLNKCLLDENFVKEAEEMLEIYGTIKFSDVGCLCEDGFCDWQEGFRKYTKEAENFWNKKSVKIKFGIHSGMTLDNKTEMRIAHPIQLFQK